MLRASLIIAALALTPLAGEAAGVRLSAEAGYLAARARGDTALNPIGALVAADQRTPTAAVHASAHGTAGALRGVFDGWLEYRHPNVGALDDDTELLVPEATLEAALGESSSVAAGLRLWRWGTGYAWNPGNPLVDPDANNTSRARAYRRGGDVFVQFETLFGRDSAGLYLTRSKQNDPLVSLRRARADAAVARYQHVLDGGDWTGFLALFEGEQFVGLTSSYTVGDQLELHGELGVRTRRHAPRIVASDIALPGAVRRLNQWDETPRDRLSTAFLLGGQYTFENRSNVIAEYFYNGNGFSRGEYAALRAAAAESTALLGEPALAGAAQGFLLEANRLVGRLRRHYLFLRVARDEVLRGTDLHYYVRAGLEDGATVHGVYLRHAFTQRARAQLGYEHYAGPPDAETRLIPVRARLEATLTIDF